MAAISARRLWFGLVGAPTAWTVQGLLGWYFGAQICTAMSIGAVRLATGGVSLAMLIVALAGLGTGWRNWREIDETPRAAADRVEFLSMGGFLVSCAFVLGIGWAMLNSLFISGCGGMR